MECDARRAPLDRRGNGFKPVPPTNVQRRRPAKRSRASAGVASSARKSATVLGL